MPHQTQVRSNSSAIFVITDKVTRLDFLWIPQDHKRLHSSVETECSPRLGFIFVDHSETWDWNSLIHSAFTGGKFCYKKPEMHKQSKPLRSRYILNKYAMGLGDLVTKKEVPCWRHRLRWDQKERRGFDRNSSINRLGDPIVYLIIHLLFPPVHLLLLTLSATYSWWSLVKKSIFFFFKHLVHFWCL